MKIDRHRLMTGIPLIDRQHEAYADLVDRLFDLARQGHVEPQALFRERRAVIQYAMEHFDAEEQLMRAENYPAYEAHRAKHDIFREWTDTLASDLEGDVDLDDYARSLSKWLIDWFCDQVQTDDRRLADFLKMKAHGCPPEAMVV